ncbi:uracil DNA glycosylase [Murid herpesvirus 3]|uniref:Uracil DNA glycosylase n=2 Tax=Murid betaherpesvirus 3 TaxID=2560603 RepID=A0A1P8VIY4_9BETA|nr:uracil DNA glycosylase [Murine roseolovirus]APZ76313.1 uracil DNA glycosylase [Murid betaherpesvirus 3]AYH64777.1 uracil DNA glycosylase [Murid herpesvirus 3]
MSLDAWLAKNVSMNEKKLTIDTQFELFEIDKSWLRFLKLNNYEIEKLKKIYEKVATERMFRNVLPNHDELHRWSFVCHPDNVKVIILGQDPYCDNRSCGVAFSSKGEYLPPSLLIIYKELERTIPGFKRPNHGNLESWCKQGVLLMNSIFTVIAKSPCSHDYMGWQMLSRRILYTLSEKKKNLVFMMWGSHSYPNISLINKKHFILVSGYPSPISMSTKPFYGNDHFLLANKYLQSKGIEPINWNSLNETP